MPDTLGIMITLSDVTGEVRLLASGTKDKLEEKESSLRDFFGLKTTAVVSVSMDELIAIKNDIRLIDKYDGYLKKEEETHGGAN